MKYALLEQHTATEKKIEKIELDTIQTKGLQTRTGTDAAKVAEYAEIYKAGGTMPPIVVFSDGGDEFYLGDGHHRLAAARKAELSEIEGLIKKGDRRAALWYATAANAQHGLPRTNEDKRRAVGLILADAEWRTLSDAQLAEHAHVSDRLIAKIRKELGAESNTRKGKDGKTRTKPAAKPKAPAKPRTSIQRELCGDGVELDDDPNYPALPPGIYLDADEAGGEYHVLISSDDQAKDVLVPGKKIRSNYSGQDMISEVRPYRIAGCLVYGVRLADGGNINELVTWNGEIRKLFACNEDRFTIGTGPKPKPGKDDSAHLATMGKPLHPPKVTDPAAPAHSAPPAAGPEDLTVDSVAQPPKPSSEIPPAAPTAPAPPAAPPAKPAPPQTKGDLILIAERDLISVELLKGKPQWTGTDNDLLALALIVGVPTRKQAWIDSVRANAHHLFVDALRSEVADRVRNGEHTNRGWPGTPELCRLWGIEYQALHIRAQHQVEK